MRNTLRGNSVSTGGTGIVNRAWASLISENVATGNTTDLVDTGGGATVAGNTFTVAPALAASDSVMGNTLGAKGTWTPHLTFGGTSSGMAFSQQVGWYEKTGNIVTAFVNATLSAKGTSVGAAEFDLPIPAATCRPRHSCGCSKGAGDHERHVRLREPEQPEVHDASGTRRDVSHGTSPTRWAPWRRSSM